MPGWYFLEDTKKCTMIRIHMHNYNSKNKLKKGIRNDSASITILSISESTLWLVFFLVFHKIGSEWFKMCDNQCEQFREKSWSS